MNWKYYLLKRNCFSSSREHLRGILIAILIVVSVLIMSTDLYNGIGTGYTLMFTLEAAVIFVLVLLYLFFPYTVSLQKTIYIVLGLLTLMIVSSLTIPGYNQEFALFALAVVPACLFFFLGVKPALKWSAVVILLLIITALNAYIMWVPPVFSTDLLVQTAVAYIVLSYFYYAMEKERSGFEKELSVSVKVKETLLKEVHHRAKNNLQTIMGFLESQAFRVSDSACKKILVSQRYRLQSMSLVHESLCADFSHDSVDMSHYLNQIINNLQKTTPHRIVSNFDSCLLEMSSAMNLGLFLNEAVSNAIKHAYSDGDRKDIEVSLRCSTAQCALRVKDFGQGFDGTAHHDSLGLVLMEDISNFFDDGYMMIDFEDGTEVVLNFRISSE